MGKGSTFERDVCSDLSTWWTGKDGESVFWRTAMSGGRATVRFRKGKNTSGHAGDVCATDPIAQPFMQLVTVEVKRGYNSDSLFNLLDKQDRHKRSGFADWLNQAINAVERAQSQYWMIISRRNQKQGMVYFPHALYETFQEHECFGRDPKPFVLLKVKIVNDQKEKVVVAFVGMLFETFLKKVTPAVVRSIIKEKSRGRRNQP